MIASANAATQKLGVIVDEPLVTERVPELVRADVPNPRLFGASLRGLAQSREAVMAVEALV